MDEPDDAEEDTDTEISDDEEDEEEAAEDPPPATAPRTGARSILRFFGFGQREAPVSLPSHRQSKLHLAAVCVRGSWHSLASDRKCETFLCDVDAAPNVQKQLYGTSTHCT